MNFDKIEADINKLIASGKIKSEKDLWDIPIDEIYKKFNICIKELTCYYCYKENTGCIDRCKK